MTADLHLWPYIDKKISPLPFSELRAAFSAMRLEKHSNGRDYRVTDKQGQILCYLSAGKASKPEDKVGFAAVLAPTKGLPLWEAIYCFLSSNRIIMIWSVGSNLFAAVASEETLEHVPKEIIAEVRSVRVASSAEELLSIVENPTFC